jgi:succinate-semialdehyde dehydrogenase / glutarate-semialdehyde dehydrogenase
MTPLVLLPPPEPIAEPAAPSVDQLLAEWGAVPGCPQELFIAGRWRPARAGRRLGVEDPSTGETLCSVADAREADAMDALAAAAEARAGWAAWPARDRARLLRRASDELLRQSGRLSMILTLEMGKPLAHSREEVSFAAEYLEWCGEEAVRVSGSCAQAPDGSSHLMVRRRPVGPCLMVTPWNFPLAVPARGVGAALAAGCTVVLRPSSLTPLSSLALAEILEGAGLPAGVLNVVVSSEDGCTDPLLADPRLRKLTFTGSTTVGRHLIGRASEQILRVSVELGGQAPFIVFADADLDAAVEGAVAAKMRNGGEACTAANRFHVERPVAAEFTARLAERLAGLRIGPGTDAGVDLGPMIGEAQRGRLVDLVEDARGLGARVVLEGGAQGGPGHFFAPVVLAGVPAAARVMREEIFGPVAPVVVFDREAEVVAHANDCPQGLAAYVYTGDLDRAMRVGDALEVGMVAVNRGRVSNVGAPFGGVKQSGYGHAGGADALGDYLDTRYLSVGLSPGG